MDLIILEGTVLCGTECQKKEVVKKNIGREVIVEDFHSSWHHGILLGGNSDEEFYALRFASREGNTEEKKFKYDNLSQMIIVKGHLEYNLSEVDELLLGKFYRPLPSF